MKGPSIKSTIIIISMAFTFIITVVMASFNFYAFDGLLKSNLQKTTSINLYLASETISKEFFPIISFASWTESNSMLTDYLKKADETQQLEDRYDKDKTDGNRSAYDDAYTDLRLQALDSWKRLLEEFHNNDSNIYIDRVVVGNDTPHVLHYARVNALYPDDVSDYIRSLPYFEEQLNSRTLHYTGVDTQSLGSINNDVIPIIRPIYTAYGSDTIGWSYMEIATSIVTDAFKNYTLPEDSLLFVTIGDYSYQIDSEQIIPVTDQKLSEALLNGPTEVFYDINSDDNISYDAITIDSSTKYWRYTQTLPSQKFTSQQQLYYFMLVIITLIVLFLGIGLTFILSNKISKPLEALLKRIHLISDGDFERDKTIEWDNEIGEIGKGINNMSENIIKLMDAKIKDQQVKSQLEYQILQSQINPHFLYNTLNSIKWMATIQNADGIAEMTTALSKLLRSVTKDISQIHPLGQEIELLDHYFLIQKYRYGGTLTLDYDIEDETFKDALVPRFSLQPIVENAIFHGIEPKNANGHIHIHVYLNKNDLMIDVGDDGIGMTKNQINAVLTTKDYEEHDFFKQIGIANVHQRIKHLFGDQYGLSIESEPNSGTTMGLHLPLTFDLEEGETHD